MNFEDLLKEKRIEFRRHGEHHHASHGWINIDCPYCSPNSGRFRMGWNLGGKYFSCWSCGKKYVGSTLQLIFNISLSESITLGKEIEAEKFKAREPVAGKLKLPPGLGPLESSHRGYLAHRGFSPNMLLNRWGIRGLNHLAGRYNWRIFIPIHVEGEIVSWTTRSIAEKVKMRYISAPAEDEKFPASMLLYGEDYCRNTVIVCEGPLDVWKIGPGAVCTFGMDYSRAQLLKISRYPKRIICFDSSPDAQRKAMQLSYDLSVFPGETQNVQLRAKDPGSAQWEEISQLRKMVN